MDDCSIATDWFSCYAKEWNPFLLPVTEQGIIIVQHGHLFHWTVPSELFGRPKI
jgi:hypothetical protein